MTTLYGKKAREQLTLNVENWEQLPQDEPVYVNHTTCEAGEDTRKRFSVVNKGGAFLWHCFNCGESGYYRPRDYFTNIGAGGTTPTYRDDKGAGFKEKYDRAHTDVAQFSTEARLWLAQYEMLDHALSYRIRCSNTGNVVLPIWDGFSLVGTQVRNFHSGPKYITSTSASQSVLDHAAGSPLFIVEDLLSSYKLHLAGAQTVCLLGTSLKGYVPDNAHKRQNILWLDKDVAGQHGAISIYRELQPLLPNLQVMYDEQPKEVSLETLKVLVKALTHEL